MLDADLKNTLLSAPLCKYLNIEEIQNIISYSKFVTFAEGDMLLQQGKRGEGLYIILEGEVIVNAKILGAGLAQFSIVKAGGFVGVISIMKNNPSSTSVIARTPLKCLLISHAYFEMMSLFLPETKYKLVRSITEGLCQGLKEKYPRIMKIINKSGVIQKSSFGRIIRKNISPTIFNFTDLELNMNILKNSPLFKYFNEDDLDELVNYGELIEAPKNCVLINENEKNKTSYIVLRGAVQTSFIYKNKLAKLIVFAPISFFCGITLVNESFPSLVNYSTRVRTTLLKIDENNMLNLQLANKKLWEKIYDLVCHSFIELKRASNRLEIRLNSEFYNIQQLG